MFNRQDDLMNALAHWRLMVLAGLCAVPLTAQEPASKTAAPAASSSKSVAAPAVPARSSSASARPARSGAALVHQQREQERARAMARELVQGVLDIQLRQLEENQLEQLPIYGDIKAMRGNLDQLVDREMQDVVQTLLKAQRGTDAEREQAATDARGKIRSVVVKLMAERQRLFKRLQVAKLAAQIRQLIGLENKVLTQTRLLPEESPATREQHTLEALENQRDIAAIHFQFVEVLADVATWEGPIGAGASQGMRLLKTLKLDQELQAADRSLAASQFLEAQQAEQAAVRGWQALLEVIEKTQGLMGTDRGALAEQVAALRKRQEALREQTRQADPQDAARGEQLAQQQHDIQQQLGQMAEALREFPQTEALAEQAKAAAFDAEAKLFEGALPEAQQQQGQVLGALAEIEQRLAQAAETQRDQTADQLAAKVQRLEQLDQAVQQARAKQNEVGQQAAANAPAAKGSEDQVAQQLQQANQVADFGAPLETRLADAQAEVAAAQQALANAAPAATEARLEAAREAAQAIDQVAAEVKQELADARREHLAVKVGELARAAEALERAAAAEQEVGETAAAAAPTGLLPETAQNLAEQQARVRQVAQEIAEGVKQTSPAAAQQLQAATPALDQVAQQLQAAKENSGDAGREATAKVAQSAQQSTQQLEQAAKTLREQAGEAATQLARIAEEQLKPVVAAREAVEKSLAAVEQAAPDSAPVEPLQAALQKTRAAQIEQLRAMGRGQQAAAEKALDQLSQAAARQQQMERAADDFARGRTNSPLAAARAAEALGDQWKQLAKEATPAVQAEMLAAAAANEEAAKEMLVGNPNTAAQARQTAREALQRARQAAEKELAAAAQQPPAGQDLPAQQQVSQFVDEAGRAVAKEAPAAEAALQAAKQQSDAAAQALSQKQPPVAAAAQEKTAEALARSTQELQNALKAEAQRRTEKNEQLARQAKELAQQAVPVDAGAAVALEQASAAAEEAAKDPLAATAETPAQTPSSSEPPATPADAVQRGLERATASLAAREQELRRDQEIAAAIAQLAKEQQAAREEISKQADQLEQLGQTPPPPPTPDAGPKPATPQMNAQQQQSALDAAAALAEAARKFAEALQATGEGAAEISGQMEVANQPIRQGLETASELRRRPATPEPPAVPPSEQPAPEVAADQNVDQRPEPGQSPDATAEQIADREPESQELGTSFVPQSPEETARRIAGQEALDVAAKALAQRSATDADPLSGDGKKKSTPQTAENSERPNESQVMEAQATQAAKKGEAALAADQSGKNEKLDPSRVEQEEAAAQRDSRTNRQQDGSDVADRKFQEEPWFANLPPALQKAIQAKSRRSAPRGYEERLKRYFENVE